MIPVASTVRAIRAGRGFSLIELLFVMGLMVIVVGMAGLWVQRGMFSASARPADELFYVASAEARIAAMNGGRTVWLRFDEQAQSFIIEVAPGQEALLSQLNGGGALPWQERDARSVLNGNDGGLAGERVQSGSGKNATDSPAQSSGGQSRFGSVAVAAGQSARFALAEGSDARVRFYALNQADGTALAEPLEAITFHPAGASTPVEVVIESGGRGGQRQVLRPDNFASGEARSGTGSAGHSASTGRSGGRW